MPNEQPTVISVNISNGGIPKLPVERAEVTVSGLVGDAHDHDKHNSPLNAVCLIDLEDLVDLKNEGFDVCPGAVGENVTASGLGIDQLNVGDQLRFSGGLVIEITKLRKPCFVLDSIDPQLKKVIVGRCGGYAKVITPGTIRPGETIEVIATTPVHARG